MSNMTSLAFPSNEKYLLVGTSGDAHYELEVFEGHLLAKLKERRSVGKKFREHPIASLW
ncbi:uncharacterized protein FOMMEDRAFT_138603 [Fomitiporia mediterranea MF3/22]|uniref:uncharacterized protein n=1 Tax=Fomitiporia mediterranea (strain MF3/22) TaxID=694068 RepID=UPI000440913F|nr:uncharacterized protein FOMMEDRAFT_138603 [Fomitiporia mediterranea MF3/22]EJD06772.1 hypothetical protein FOMMEDRAFT_138603 [Fomitiporia mediterranea MF3/22]